MSGILVFKFEEMIAFKEGLSTDDKGLVYRSINSYYSKETKLTIHDCEKWKLVLNILTDQGYELRLQTALDKTAVLRMLDSAMGAERPFFKLKSIIHPSEVEHTLTATEESKEAPVCLLDTDSRFVEKHHATYFFDIKENGKNNFDKIQHQLIVLLDRFVERTEIKNYLRSHRPDNRATIDSSMAYQFFWDEYTGLEDSWLGIGSPRVRSGSAKSSINSGPAPSVVADSYVFLHSGDEGEGCDPSRTRNKKASKCCPCWPF